MLTSGVLHLGLSEEHVKYMGVVARQQRHPFSINFNFGRPNRQNIFSCGSNNFQPSQTTNSQKPKKSLEENLDQYMNSTQNQIEALSKNQEESRRKTKASTKIWKLKLG